MLDLVVIFLVGTAAQRIKVYTEEIMASISLVILQNIQRVAGTRSRPPGRGKYETEGIRKDGHMVRLQFHITTREWETGLVRPKVAVTCGKQVEALRLRDRAAAASDAILIAGPKVIRLSMPTQPLRTNEAMEETPGATVAFART